MTIRSPEDPDAISRTLVTGDMASDALREALFSN